VNKLANLDFYNKEIQNIQQQLIDKLDNLVVGLGTLSETELIQIAKQIDFFDEMEKLGYGKLMNKVGKTYDDEIAKVFAELSKPELRKVSAVSIDALRELKNFEMTYLTNGVRQYSDQLKTAMLRGIITGESNIQIMNNINNTFGIGTYISSSETSFLINDAFSRFSNATRAKAYEEFPEVKFKYVGTNDDKTRDVCKRALQEEPLTRKEIDALGYVSFTDRGGYNCRHDWVRVR
jgi:hypothetical protein|tara:strand:+ start:1577 stop:2281 length:705 start_codon:yes stop_codon:yes gene_type:complete